MGLVTAWPLVAEALPPPPSPAAAWSSTTQLRLQLPLTELMGSPSDLGPTLRRLAQVRRAQVAAVVMPLQRPAGRDALRTLPWWQETRALGFYQPLALEAADGRWLALDTVSVPALQPGRSQATVGVDLGAGWLGDLLEPGPHSSPTPAAPASASDGQSSLPQ